MLLLIQANPLNDLSWLFPALEVWHILGLALSIGTIAIVDFRLLGFGMKRQTAAEMAKDLAPWTLVGLMSMLLSGGLMFATDPDMYYLNHPFQIKMGCLLAAIIFQYTIHRKVVAAGSGGVIAGISLFLWASVVGGGIFTGFYA